MDIVVLQYTELRTEAPLGGVEMHINKVSDALERLGLKVAVGKTACESQLPHITKNQTAVVHLHGDCAVPRKFLESLRQLGIPTFLMPVYHGTTAGRMIACREYFSPAGYRSLLKEFKIALRANAAVCVSPLAEQEARRYYFLRCPTVVIENAADVEIFRPLKAISEEPRILFIGRSGDRVKNTDRILEAVSQVAKKGTRIILSAVPGISNTNSNNIESLGPKNSFDLYKLFQSSRALILGSLYEGDPIVLHEAKSAGLPILASDLPQMRYALLNYKNSYFFNPRNTDAIANQIESLLADPNLKPCSLASSWSNSAKKLLNFYSQQIAAQRS